MTARFPAHWLAAAPSALAASGVLMCADASARQGRAPEPLGAVCGGDESQVDCKKDDYFKVRPPGDSYLAKHRNVARSKFLVGS